MGELFHKGDKVIFSNPTYSSFYNKIGEVTYSIDNYIMVQFSENIKHKNRQSKIWQIESRNVEKYHNKNKRLR